MEAVLRIGVGVDMETWVSAFPSGFVVSEPIAKGGMFWPFEQKSKLILRFTIIARLKSWLIPFVDWPFVG